MRFAAVLLIFVVGCGEPAAVAPKLRAIGVGFLPDSFPLVFAVKVVNDGNATVYVDDVRFHVEYRLLLYDSDAGGTVPDGFDCAVGTFGSEPDANGNFPILRAGDAIAIGLGERADISGAVEWIVPKGARPMLAVVRASFQPMRGGKVVVESEPLIIVLQSEAGALSLVRDATTTSTAEAKQVLAALEAIDGRRSHEFTELLDSIRAIARTN